MSISEHGRLLHEYLNLDTMELKTKWKGCVITFVPDYGKNTHLTKA